jgi:2-dehydro-3-deoxygluconokinase
MVATRIELRHRGCARGGIGRLLVTALGQDEFGDEMMRLWIENGVDASKVILRNAQAHTGVYFVTHGDEGHSFSYLRAGSAASR